jgi:HEAT repeat protein
MNARAKSLASAAAVLICLPLFAFMVAIPVYSQSPSDKAWEILKAGATNKSLDSRIRAMHAMGLIGQNPTAEKVALAALADKDPQVRTAAATCLGEVGSKNEIPPLKEALKENVTEVVFASTAALYKLNDPAAYQVYYAVLTRTRKSGESLMDSQMNMLKDKKAMANLAFEQGIGFIPFAGVGLGAFKAITKDDESPVRAAAAVRLARDPDPKSAEALATAAGDEKWMVRAAAIDAIGRRGDAVLLKAVVPRLTDENEIVRFNAAACVLRLSK